MKNKMDEELISLKAIVTLHHCHNHMKEYSTRKEKVCTEMQDNESFENHSNTENHLNNTRFDESTNLILSSNSKASATNDNCEIKDTEFAEKAIVYEPENNIFVTNDNTQIITFDCDGFELSEEFDNYNILIGNVITGNFLHFDNNEK